MKNKIVYKIINYDKNKKLLESVPHYKMLDLAVVYYCLLEQNDGSQATALIYNKHLEGWNINREEINKYALINTPLLLKPVIKKMSEVMLAMLDDMGISEQIGSVLEDIKNLEDYMYVMTNTSKINGASCILYDDILEEFSRDIDSDLYILPSSIHEVIIIPSNKLLDENELSQMVKDVNKEVSIDEILSDHVYFYSKTNKFLSM